MTDIKTLITTTLNTLKSAQDYCKSQETGSQLTEDLLEARENLQTVREAYATLLERRDELQEKIDSLEESLTLRASLVRHQGVYWRRNDPDPWCPQCWEHEHRALHLNPSAVLAGRLYVCQRCSFDINLDHVNPPKIWPDAE